MARLKNRMHGLQMSYVVSILPQSNKNDKHIYYTFV